jgi:uncharacterized protein involved in response to NO
MVHLERLEIADVADAGFRLSIYSVATLIALIGGRIVPSFTRNWLAKNGADAMPAPFGWLDKVAIGTAVVVLAGETFYPDTEVVAGFAVAAGVLHLVRLGRWRGHAAFRDPLVWSLHLGYAWLGVGLILVGLAEWDLGVPPSAATHAITTGAFGTMILAVATRASLGHTGRPLTAGPGTTLIYVLVSAAAASRVAASAFGAHEMTILWFSAAAWVGAFGLFTVLYFPVLTRHRVDRMERR